MTSFSLSSTSRTSAKQDLVEELGTGQMAFRPKGEKDLAALARLGFHPDFAAVTGHDASLTPDAFTRNEILLGIRSSAIQSQTISGRIVIAWRSLIARVAPISTSGLAV